MNVINCRIWNEIESVRYGVQEETDPSIRPNPPWKKHYYRCRFCGARPRCFGQNIQTLSCDFIDRDSFSKLFVYNKFPQTISLQLLISNIVSCIQNLNKSRLIFYDKNFLLKELLRLFYVKSFDRNRCAWKRSFKEAEVRGLKGGLCVDDVVSCLRRTIFVIINTVHPCI